MAMSGFCALRSTEEAFPFSVVMQELCCVFGRHSLPPPRPLEDLVVPDDPALMKERGQEPQRHLFISRNHFCIVLDPPNWNLIVLGKNGVIVDGRMHSASPKGVVLHPGSVIQLGHLSLEFLVNRAGQPTTCAAPPSHELLFDLYGANAENELQYIYRKTQRPKADRGGVVSFASTVVSTEVNPTDEMWGGYWAPPTGLVAAAAQEDNDDDSEEEGKAKKKRRTDDADDAEKVKSKPKSAARRRVVAIPRDPEGNPIFPIKLSNLVIHTLGVVDQRSGFHTGNYIWPVGYRSTRMHHSTVTPSTRVAYECEILASSDEPNAHPVFSVTPSDSPDTVYSERTPTGAWGLVVKAVWDLKLATGTEGGASKPKAVSGPELFGFALPAIRDLIVALPGASDCARYRPK